MLSAIEVLQRRLVKLVLPLFALICIVPLLAGLLYSLAYSLGLAGALSDGFTANHWARLFGADGTGWEAGSFFRSEVWRSAGYSAYLTFFSLLFILLFSLPLSFMVSTETRYRSLLPWLFLPLTIPPVVAAFVFFEWLSPAGLFSRISYALGITHAVSDFPRLINDPASISIIAAQVFLLYPFFTLIFQHQARQDNMLALRTAARSLGAGARSFFFRVYLPVVLRRSLPLLLLYAVYLFGSYEIPMLLGRSAPRAVTVYIAEQLSRFDLNNIPLAHAMALLYAILVIFFLLLLLTGRRRRLIEA